jgi:hypothetical protein
MTTAVELKKWIDDAPYDELLRKWRFAPSGDPLFMGEVGEHFREVMFRKKRELGDVEAVAASKRIGWSS